MLCSDNTRTGVGRHGAGRRLGRTSIHAAHDLALGDDDWGRLRHDGVVDSLDRRQYVMSTHDDRLPLDAARRWQKVLGNTTTRRSS